MSKDWEPPPYPGPGYDPKTDDPRRSGLGQPPFKVSKWVPMTDPVDLAHLGKLAEEANELGSAIARCIIQGVNGVDPDNGKINRVWLMEEIADVLANIDLVGHHFGLDHVAIRARAARKYEAKKRWHAMLREED